MIGIHRGPGLAGLVGSRERMEYAFVGRTVNLAARVQTLTRVHHADILVTEALRAEIDSRFVLTPMPPEMVKGIDEPVVTYAVRTRAETPAASARWRPATGRWSRGRCRRSSCRLITQRSCGSNPSPSTT